MSDLSEQGATSESSAISGSASRSSPIRNLRNSVLNWQNLIGALIGFAGVCTTIWSSFEVSRLDALRKDQAEAAALRRGLYTELSLIATLASGAEQDAKKSEGSDKPVPFAMVDRNLLYQANLNKLTDLTPDEVAAVYQAYDVAALTDANVPTIFPRGGAGILVARSPSEKAHLITMMDSVYDAASKAMKALDAHMQQ